MELLKKLMSDIQLGMSSSIAYGVDASAHCVHVHVMSERGDLFFFFL